MTAGEVSFPDGVVVRGAAVTDRETNADWRDYGLYLDARWAPTWPATVLDWPDFGLPTSDADAIGRSRRRSIVLGPAATSRWGVPADVDAPGRSSPVWRCSPVLRRRTP
jgi:hypothetical protein